MSETQVVDNEYCHMFGKRIHWALIYLLSGSLFLFGCIFGSIQCLRSRSYASAKRTLYAQSDHDPVLDRKDNSSNASRKLMQEHEEAKCSRSFDEITEWIQILGHKPCTQINRSVFRTTVAVLSNAWYNAMDNDHQLEALNELINISLNMQSDFNGLNRCGHPIINVRNYLLKKHIMDAVPSLKYDHNQAKLDAVFELFKTGKYENWEQRLDAVSDDDRFDHDFS